MPKPLAEIALEEELCTKAALDEAAQVSDDRRIPLVAVLIRELELDELTLLASLRRHVRVPTPDPASAAVDPEAVRVLSRDICRRLRVMPLSIASYDAGPAILRLAMADPTDAVAVAEVEHETGCRVEPELLTLSAVEELVERSYGAYVTEVMKRVEDGEGASGAFGGDLEVKTARMETPGESGQPSTVPYHRISDDAELELRHEALLGLLYEKGLLSEDEYEERVRELMKERSDQG